MLTVLKTFSTETPLNSAEHALSRFSFSLGSKESMLKLEVRRRFWGVGKWR